MDANGDPVAPPLPCMWFAAGAAGNTVAALKDGQAPQGFDVCTQIYLGYARAQNVPGYEKCGAVPERVLVAMVQREGEFQQKACESSGGAWSGYSCTCPAGYALNSATGQCESQ